MAGSEALLNMIATMNWTKAKQKAAPKGDQPATSARCGNDGRVTKSTIGPGFYQALTDLPLLIKDLPKGWKITLEFQLDELQDGIDDLHYDYLKRPLRVGQIVSATSRKGMN